MPYVHNENIKMKFETKFYLFFLYCRNEKCRARTLKMWLDFADTPIHKMAHLCA